MSLMKRIDEIAIQNVKGIGQKQLFLSLIPNKPNLLVAPNGFGKSSFAAAFLSLQRNRLDLHKDNFHKEDEKLAPSLVVKYTLDDNSKGVKEANQHKNELAHIFDIFVINNQLVPKARKIKISGALIAMPSLEISPITLIAKIPEKAKFSYSYTTTKASFGANGKILNSIDAVISDHSLISRCYDEVDFAKSVQVKSVAAISALKNFINDATGTVDDLFSAIPTALTDVVESLPHISQIVAILKNEKIVFVRPLDFVLTALQITELHNSDKALFKKVAGRYAYLLEKGQFEQAFASLKGTWKNIAPVEDKKAGLIVSFPAANKISNGERDSICFFALLMQAKVKLKKQQCVLVIDEVFDYLDDANLVVAQYYLSQMITEFKAQGRQLFPLIMTHLNPVYFKNFCLKDQHIFYLDKHGTSADRSVEKIIVNREHPSIKNDVSKYFLHYHPNAVDLNPEFHALGLLPALATAKQFEEHVFEELRKYLGGHKYDPVSVCCAVRLMIEKWSYDALNSAFHAEYLSTWKTPAKLEFVEQKGIDAPEVFYLLGVIYNEAMHLRDNRDNFSPLSSKLSNLTIKHMISWCHDFCGLAKAS